MIDETPKWVKVGYLLTAIWMCLILFITGGQLSHPYFRYIFIIPIIAWIVVKVIITIFEKMKNR